MLTSGLLLRGQTPGVVEGSWSVLTGHQSEPMASAELLFTDQCPGLLPAQPALGGCRMPRLKAGPVFV